MYFGPERGCSLNRIRVCLGESAVGKSSLVLRFVKGQFHEYQESTIGGDSCIFKCVSIVMYFSDSCLFDTNSKFRWYDSEVWNMGYSWTRKYPLNYKHGHQHALLSLMGTWFSKIRTPWSSYAIVVNLNTQWSRYHSLAPMYYRGAQAAIVVYDVTNQVSTVKLVSWV